MASEVRVKFTGDTKDLRKAVADARAQIGQTEISARRAAQGFGDTAKKLDETKKAAQQFLEDSRKMRQELEGVGDAAGDAGDSLEQTGRRAASAGKVLGGIFGVGIILQFVLELKDKLWKALTETSARAREVRSEFESTFSALSDFSNTDFSPRVFENREQIIEEARRLQADLEDVNNRIESLGGDSRQAKDGIDLLGVNIESLDEAGRKIKGLFSDTQRQNNLIIAQEKDRQAEIQGQLNALQKQIEGLDRAARIDAGRTDSNLKTREEMEAQADALERAKAAQEELLKLQIQAFVATPAPRSFVDRSRPERPEALPQVPERVFDESAIDAARQFRTEMAALSDLLDANVINSLDATYSALGAMQQRLSELASQGLAGTLEFEQLNKQFQALRGTLQEFEDKSFALGTLSDLAVTAGAAIVNVQLGFEDAKSAAESLRDSVRGLVGDLIRAAARAAVFSGIAKALGIATGGGGSLFSTFLRQGLGIPALASGGIVNRPTLSLIGEAGPEAVIPLNRLQEMGGGARKLEATTLRVSGGDLLIAIREAERTGGRSFGNLTLD